MSRALQIMRELNPRAFMDIDGDYAIFIEDILVDDRFYRVEITSSPDGSRAIARCLYLPWPNNPHSYLKSHLATDGTLCLSADCHGDLTKSRTDVRTAILRARYWCVGFAVLMETGVFPEPPSGGNA